MSLPITYEIECLPEDEKIEGNCLVSGDEKIDKECADWIIDQLRRGNEWAWCSVKVTARQGAFTGYDYLGCCSYKNEEDFKADGYWEDMRARAYADLKDNIEQAKRDLDGICDICNHEVNNA